MLIAKVIGNVWSTKKNELLNAKRLLFVQPLNKKREATDEVLVVADEIGAGAGELVLITQGSPAMMAFGDLDNPLPIDAVVIGIVDSLEIFEE